jgi:trimethylamine--corrinoid protein Co-methyltransferase
MEADYVYPKIADRQVPSAWEDSGSKDMLTRGRERAREILARHYPHNIPPDIDASIRARYDILLPAEVVRPRRTV